MAQPVRPIHERFWEKVETGPGCWLWLGCRTAREYGRFVVVHGHEVRAHRMAWELIHGPIPDELNVLHRCDNPPCVRPAHLFLGTHRDNVDDKVTKGRLCVGEDHGSSKLTEQDVRDIRQLREQGLSLRDVALMFEIDRSTVADVAKHQTWKHVP